MKKIFRAPQNPKNNGRNTRRVIMVKSATGRLSDALKDERPFRVQLVNVSFTGAQVYSNKSINEKTKISLDLDSLDGTQRLTYVGRVVWVRKNPLKSMGRYAYGVRFDNVTTEHIHFLENNYSLQPAPAVK